MRNISYKFSQIYVTNSILHNLRKRNIICKITSMFQGVLNHKYTCYSDYYCIKCKLHNFILLDQTSQLYQFS